MSKPKMLAPNDPGLEPPPGVTPDFESPYTLQPYQALTVAACIILTTVMVVARLFTKIKIIKAVKWEDYTCVFGWASFMVYLGIQFSIGRHGGGTHQWNVLYKDVQYGWRYTNYGDMMYSLAMFFTKYSIMLLILRIFCSVQRDIPYWLTHILILVNGIFYVLFFIIPIFLCSPRLKIWNPDAPGHCLKANILYLASAVFNMISDIAMLSVPVYLIWSLQMSLRRKVGVSALFGTGLLACLASILRLIYTVILTRTKDYTYVKVQCILWAFAEIAFGLLCSCFVILPRLYQHLSSIVPNSGRNTSSAPGLAAGRPHHYSIHNDQRNHNGKRDWVQLEEQRIENRHHLGKTESEGEQELQAAVEGTDRL